MAESLRGERHSGNLACGLDGVRGCLFGRVSFTGFMQLFGFFDQSGREIAGFRTEFSTRAQEALIKSSFVSQRYRNDRRLFMRAILAIVQFTISCIARLLTRSFGFIQVDKQAKLKNETRLGRKASLFKFKSRRNLLV